MDWWLLMSKLVPMLVVVFATEIILARRNQKRLARLEAISGHCNNEGTWVGVVVKDLTPPETHYCECCSPYPVRLVSSKGGLS
jgi:hypothetical protein